MFIIMKNDIIVIGAGLGGLFSGAKLAKEGKKVLLIEQHTIPGGCATVFKRKGYTFEVGLHEMDGLHEDDFKVNIFKDLNIYENVEFLEIPEFYRFTNGRVDIVIPHNVDQAIKNLVRVFPDEESGIRKYFDVIINLPKEMFRFPKKKWKQLLLFPFVPILYPKLAKYLKMSLGDFLDTIITNDDLKLVLLANLGYYHDDPYSMAMSWYCMAQSNYYTGGAHYIKGGSQKLSDYLSQFILDNGGEVLLGYRVEKIIVENNRAIGVEFRKTRSDNTETKKVFADEIIANASVPNVVNNLLSSDEATVLKAKTKELKTSCSLFSIYIGFKKPIKEIGNKYYSTFILNSGVKNQTDLANCFKGDLSSKGFVFVDYSQIDSQLAPEGKGVGSICTIDYTSVWENLTKEEYNKKKEEVAQTFFNRLERVIPGIKQEIDYYEVATAKTIERYTLNPQGSVYGYAQTPEQAVPNRIKQKSPIENLYFASAWTFPGGGFGGAIISGYLCAIGILFDQWQ
ncbi:MAG: phytoene desaturase family protein [Candidatus Heimdallarchaeaceae archaeon]